MKRIVAVFFGGRSPEHDVSVVTALQVMNALDSTRYDVIPVYLSLNGQWLTGEGLRQQKNYIPRNDDRTLIELRLELSPQKRPRFIKVNPGFMGNPVIEFDIALLAFHGLFGEDGALQGVFETANIPYTGMRLLASSIFMDKVLTKRLLMAEGIPMLPFCEVRRPPEGTYVSPDSIRKLIAPLKAPYCVKPSHLGSSIGVAKANTVDEISAALPSIFTYDAVALVEPFVPHMVEYNVAVARRDTKIVTSAIECPKRVEELLNFKEKYQAGGKSKSGQKIPGSSSIGMLAMTREINVVLPEKIEDNIRKWASQAYECVMGTGVPRIDFISNKESGEVWLNEVNPCPGSFGYFLWEASRNHRILFTELLDHLLEEALMIHLKNQLPKDPVPELARLLKR